MPKIKKHLNTYALRVEMARTDLRQHQLASKIGISRQRLHWMIKNKSASNMDVVADIAKVLNVPPETLVLN